LYGQCKIRSISTMRRRGRAKDFIQLVDCLEAFKGPTTRSRFSFADFPLSGLKCTAFVLTHWNFEEFQFVYLILWLSRLAPEWHFCTFFYNAVLYCPSWNCFVLFVCCEFSCFSSLTFEWLAAAFPTRSKYTLDLSSPSRNVHLFEWSYRLFSFALMMLDYIHHDPEISINPDLQTLLGVRGNFVYKRNGFSHSGTLEINVY
jgi:hypothetical protein